MILFGSWIRMLAIDGTFWPVLLGQVIVSLAQPIVYNVMTQFCNKWFTDKERSLCTSVCGLSIPGGNLIAFGLSGFIFRGVETKSSLQVKQ